jgi:hypothetical protein
VVDGADPPVHPLLQLYKKPEQAGFYVIGTEDYQRLEPQPLVQLGNDLRTLRGLHEVGDIVVEGSKIRVLFHTPLKMDQVMRLGLQLHRLEYQRETQMVGSVEMQTIAVNLWTSAQLVDTQVEPLRSRNDYLIESKTDVEPGAYAFDTQGLLSGQDAESFKEIPEPLRVAYAMEVR